MPADSPTMQITLPVLNEEKILRESVGKIVELCEREALNVTEICIANNGSTDATEAIGLDLAAKYTQIRYENVRRRGFGLALKAGWRDARSDFVGYMDIDLATDLYHLVDIQKLLEQEPQWQIVAGSRLLKESRVIGRTPLRAVTTRVFNTLLRMSLGVQFTDAMCGFKFFQRTLVTDLLARYPFMDDWFFVTELMVRAEREGARIKDLPVRWIDDHDSASSARLVNLSLLYLRGINALRRERV